MKLFCPEIFRIFYILQVDGVLSVQNPHPDSTLKQKLVGGVNPFEKYWSNWIISPGRDENKKKKLFDTTT